jgi:uncharacterized protein YqjF (DUF2071 family)
MIVSAQPRPHGMAVMHQQWAKLLFLHWVWDAEIIQKTLRDRFVKM